MSNTRKLYESDYHKLAKIILTKYDKNIKYNAEMLSPALDKYIDIRMKTARKHLEALIDLTRYQAMTTRMELLGNALDEINAVLIYCNGAQRQRINEFYEEVNPVMKALTNKLKRMTKEAKRKRRSIW